MPRVRERLSITRISAGPAGEVPLNLRGAFALMRRETAKSRLPKILPAGVTEGQREQDRERERERERESGKIATRVHSWRSFVTRVRLFKRHDRSTSVDRAAALALIHFAYARRSPNGFSIFRVSRTTYVAFSRSRTASRHRHYRADSDIPMTTEPRGSPQVNILLRSSPFLAAGAGRDSRPAGRSRLASRGISEAHSEAAPWQSRQMRNVDT